MPGGDYRDALRERAGWTPEPGPVLDADGARVGEHAGLGRVHGRPAARASASLADAPRYVSRIDPLTNTIQLGRREDLETRTVAAGRRDVRRRSAAQRIATRPFRADVRIRHRATPVPATVRPATPTEPAPRRPLGRRDGQRPSGPRARARQPCSTPATSSSAAVGSSGPTVADVA